MASLASLDQIKLKLSQLKVCAKRKNGEIEKCLSSGSEGR